MIALVSVVAYDTSPQVLEECVNSFRYKTKSKNLYHRQ